MRNITNVLTVTEAEAELKKYTDAEHNLAADLQTLKSDIASTEGLIGETILQARLSGDNKTTGKVSQDLNALRNEVDIMQRALVAARTMRIVASNNLLTAQAAVKRQEAAKIREEVSERLTKTRDLLQQLIDHEECGYTYVPKLNPAQTGYEPGPATKSQILAAEATELEREATELERTANENKRSNV
jgi:hypothetical protein